MPHSHDIPTTHIALWPLHRAPDGDLALWLTPTDDGLAPLATSLLHGETPESALHRLLALSAPLTDLGYRYDLPLLADVPTAERRIPTGCVAAYGVAVPPDWAAPSLRRIPLLDALAGLRYAEHVETLLRLWRLYAA